MAVSLSSIADHLASLGLDAAKAFLKEKIDEVKLRSALTEYIEQQRQCHDFCTLAEEFDYQGLVDYIRRELLSDVEKRFFDTNSHNRASAQQSIIDKAIIYANAETPEAKKEVAKLVAVSLELIRGFYKKDFSKKDYLLAAEIVDAVRDDTTRIVQDAITGIKGKLSNIETVVLANKKVISMDNAVESFENNGFAQIEAEHRKLFDYFSLQHILYPYYGYRMENGKVCSIPLRADSLEFAPPKLSITGAVRVPDNVSALFGKDPCSYAYRHQQTLMIDVSGAKKYLGDVMDPVQSEAEAWIGKRIVATPPKLSPVVPCAIYVGEQVFFDYILFRIEEILDDDTFIISNKEQQNNPISFAVYMKLNADKADFQFNIRENATNRDVLNFALFIKALDKREAMIIRRLDTRETFMSGIMSGGDYKIRFDSIDDEIDYLKRICAIEEYFAVSISPWGDISIDEYRAVVRLSDMIIHGHVEYRWNKSTLTGSFTEKFREAINEQDDKQFLLQMHATEDFSFHGTTVEVCFLRTYQSAVLEDMERIKKLAELLRPGESINLTFVPGENDIVVEELETADILVQGITSAACIFLMRWLWKVYSQVWRYGGIQSYIRLLVSDGCAFLLFYLVEQFLPVRHISFARVLCISCLSLLASLTIRMVYRYAYKCCSKNTGMGRVLNVIVKVFAGNRIELDNKEQTNKIRVAIVGAGKVGVSLAEELLGNRASAYVPICFIDTDPLKTGRAIQGIPVIAESEATGDMLEHYGIQEIIVALPQLSSEEKKALYEKYKPFRCKIKVYDYPTMQQAGDTKRHLREFDVEELLFRKPIVMTDEKTGAYYRGKVVLITGGGGSIGSELCRQVAKMSPKKLVLLDVYENGVYDVQQELKIAYKSELDVCVEILSVCNRPALERVFDRYRPQIVIHAAAHKHVPLMEHNCCEAIENNVFGTLNAVELAEKYHAQRFMMVSTDKAVNPTNVMGATKRMCEMIVQSHSKTSDYTTFSATRFGNVLGSAGSVIPLFKRQILNGGPITVTDKRIIRYFMTIPEASQLVLQSGAMAKNGELFVLDMGKPVKILDLAENMVRLSGYEPYRDIDIIETGLRPGEKLYEELLVNTEELDKTENSLIFIERDEPIGKHELAEKLAILKTAYLGGDDDEAREALHQAVPTFHRPEEVNAVAEKAEEMRVAVTV